MADIHEPDGTITFPADRGIPVVWETLNPRQLEQVREIVREEIQAALLELIERGALPPGAAGSE